MSPILRVWCDSYVNAFRAEKVALGKWPSRLKVLGALTCVGGTMIVSLLKGHLLHLWPTHLLKISHGSAPASGGHHHDMLTGTLFLSGSCLSYAVWFIVQVYISSICFEELIEIHISLIAPSCIQ